MPSTDREVSKQAKVSLATADGPELRRRRPPKSTQGPTSPLPPPAFCPPRQPSRARLPAESWDLAHHKVWDPRACPASAGEAPAGAVQVLRAQPSGRHHLALTRQGTRTSAYAGGKAQNCSNLRQLTCLRPPAASLRPRPLRDAGFRQAATAARQPDPGRTAHSVAGAAPAAGLRPLRFLRALPLRPGRLCWWRQARPGFLTLPRSLSHCRGACLSVKAASSSS